MAAMPDIIGGNETTTKVIERIRIPRIVDARILKNLFMYKTGLSHGQLKSTTIKLFI